MATLGTQDTEPEKVARRCLGYWVRRISVSLSLPWTVGRPLLTPASSCSPDIPSTHSYQFHLKKTSGRHLLLLIVLVRWSALSMVSIQLEVTHSCIGASLIESLGHKTDDMVKETESTLAPVANRYCSYLSLAGPSLLLDEAGVRYTRRCVNWRAASRHFTWSVPPTQ